MKSPDGVRVPFGPLNFTNRSSSGCDWLGPKEKNTYKFSVAPFKIPKCQKIMYAGEVAVRISVPQER